MKLRKEVRPVGVIVAGYLRMMSFGIVVVSLATFIESLPHGSRASILNKSTELTIPFDLLLLISGWAVGILLFLIAMKLDPPKDLQNDALTQRALNIAQNLGVVGPRVVVEEGREQDLFSTKYRIQLTSSILEKLSPEELEFYLAFKIARANQKWSSDFRYLIIGMSFALYLLLFSTVILERVPVGWFLAFGLGVGAPVAIWAMLRSSQSSQLGVLRADQSAVTATKDVESAVSCLYKLTGSWPDAMWRWDGSAGTPSLKKRVEELNKMREIGPNGSI